MNYQPKILFNPTDKYIEFMCDKKVYGFQPGEKVHCDGFIAYHGLVQTNTGLKEYVPGEDEDVSRSRIAYDKMPYRELVSLASKEGLYKPGKGQTKAKMIQALIELDEQREAA
jgi:hypothetical protein